MQGLSSDVTSSYHVLLYYTHLKSETLICKSGFSLYYWLNYIFKDQLFQKSTRAFAVGSADNGFCPVINKPSTSTCERKGALAV